MPTLTRGRWIAVILAMLFASALFAQGEFPLMRYNDDSGTQDSPSLVSVDDASTTDTASIRVPSTFDSERTGYLWLNTVRNDQAGFAARIGADDDAMAPLLFADVQEALEELFDYIASVTVTPANPSAEVDGAAVNGVATTYMRSDAAPPLADPFTPADGTQNVAGNLTASATVQGGSQVFPFFDNGITGYTVGGNGVFGSAASTGSGNGVAGTVPSGGAGVGVHGSHGGSGFGGYFTSTTGIGLKAEVSANTAATLVNNSSLPSLTVTQSGSGLGISVGSAGAGADFNVSSGSGTAATAGSLTGVALLARNQNLTATNPIIVSENFHNGIASFATAPFLRARRSNGDVLAELDGSGNFQIDGEGQFDSGIETNAIQNLDGNNAITVASGGTPAVTVANALNVTGESELTGGVEVETIQNLSGNSAIGIASGSSPTVTVTNALTSSGAFTASVGATVRASSGGSLVGTFVTTTTGDDPTEQLRQYRGTTTNGTQTTLATLTFDTASMYVLTIIVEGRRTGGSSGATGDCGGYRRDVVVKCAGEGGATTVNGSSSAVDITVIYEDQSGWAADIIQSAGNALIRVTGASNNNVTWQAHVWIRPLAS